MGVGMNKDPQPVYNWVVFDAYEKSLERLGLNPKKLLITRSLMEQEKIVVEGLDGLNRIDFNNLYWLLTASLVSENYVTERPDKNSSRFYIRAKRLDESNTLFHLFGVVNFALLATTSFTIFKVGLYIVSIA